MTRRTLSALVCAVAAVSLMPVVSHAAPVAAPVTTTPAAPAKRMTPAQRELLDSIDTELANDGHNRTIANVVGRPYSPATLATCKAIARHW